MKSLQEFVEEQSAKGRGFFTKSAALAACAMNPTGFQGAAARLCRKGRLASPRRGFYLILRPEDRALGAPDPACWIGPLMAYLGLDYRVSLLRATAFHGCSHQAAMVFQVIVPRQLPPISIGRHQLRFHYQEPGAFAKVNRSEWLTQQKTESGFALLAGVELTLLDMCRYHSSAGGMNGVAQAVEDLGRKARGRILAAAAAGYENACVRRLGYLLERFGHGSQARALLPFAAIAKSSKPLDPSSLAIIPGSAKGVEHHSTWKLDINVTVETDH